MAAREPVAHTAYVSIHHERMVVREPIAQTLVSKHALVA
jgi:hypothetical protein